MFYDNWYNFDSTYTTSFTSSSTTTSDSSYWYSGTGVDTTPRIVKELLDAARRSRQEEARWKEKDDAMDEYISQISVLGA